MTDFDAPPPARRTTLGAGRDALQREAPPLLQRYGEGELALPPELAARFPNAPTLALFHARVVHERGRLEAATLSTQDGAAQVQVLAEGTRSLQLTFQAYGMLGLSFTLNRLSDADRRHWLASMRQPDDVAFLWSAQRWDSDYVITTPERFFCGLYAFSPRHTEAAARLTPEVTSRLLTWLESLWLGAS